MNRTRGVLEPIDGNNATRFQREIRGRGTECGIPRGRCSHRRRRLTGASHVGTEARQEKHTERFDNLAPHLKSLDLALTFFVAAARGRFTGVTSTVIAKSRARARRGPPAANNFSISWLTRRISCFVSQTVFRCARSSREAPSTTGPFE